MIPLLLQSPLLRAAGFRHGFSTRAVDFRPPADAGVAAESVALAGRYDRARLHQAEQVHGARALRVSGSPARVAAERADALVATCAGDAVGVRVADCVPVLLVDPVSGAVAAVHAGWRGIVAGVIAAAASVAAETGARLTLAAIGPSIGPCCFEVGADVAEEIARASTPDAVARRAGDKALVDLRRAVRFQLRALGLGDAHVDDVAGCTRCDEEQFFSHRRDGDAAGRHLAFVVARAPL